MTTPGEGGNQGVTAVIPARFGSTRFPGKPLALLAGKPMVQHVYERTAQAPSVTRVLVATDDRRIRDAVRAFGGEAVMTGPHPTGTDRIAEAVRRSSAGNAQPAWVLNVQGDEPLIDPADLERLIRGMGEAAGGVLGTLVFPLHSEPDWRNPNVVKAVLDQAGRALFFSRAPIPYPREPGENLGWRHLGVYLFRTDFLFAFQQLPPTPLSQQEQLEQLRALENGYPIHCFEAATLTHGVDVPEDLARAEALLAAL